MNELPFRYIGQTEHNALFHYEKFKAEHLSGTLRDLKIHCSNPVNFNDPWDCKPWFDYESIEDPETLEKLLTFLRKQNPGGLEESRLNIYENGIRAKKYERINLITSLSETNIATIAKRRIYCLTPHPDSTLMWSHYAENHKGICLEFGVDNPLFRLALEVTYPEVYPVWLPHAFEDENNKAIQMILTKAHPWHYEHEFRLISLLNNDLDTPLRIEDGCFTLPPGSLRSVIAGCDADYDAVRAIVKAHLPDVPVKQAIRLPNHFSLAIMDEPVE